MVFFKEMRNYFVFFILFGLWATWKNSEYNHHINICSFLSIILAIGVFFSAFYFNIIYVFDSFVNTVSNALLILTLTIHLVIVVEPIFQKELQSKLIQSLCRVDKLFNNKSKVIISYQREKWELFTRCFLLVSILIFVNLFWIFYTYYQNLFYDFMYPTMYSYFVLCLKPIQIIFFVCLLRKRLILINNELCDIQKAQTNDVNHSKSKYCHTRDELDSSNSTVEQSINDRLFNLKLIYGELYESCELINASFGSSMLAFTVQAFIELTTNCYWAYFCLENVENFILYILVPAVVLQIILGFYCTSCFQYVSYLINSTIRFSLIIFHFRVVLLR